MNLTQTQDQTYDRLPVHFLPPGKLFRIYISDGLESREVLWFKYNDKGDLVTKPAVSGAKIFRSYGTKHNGTFELTQPVKVLTLTGNEKSDHTHLTYHPSTMGKPAPVLHGVRKEAHYPMFDTRTLSGLREVTTHQLASPKDYAVRAPKGEDGKYHAMLNRPYNGAQQPTVTFWVAPLNRGAKFVPDELLVRECFIYAKCTPAGLPHDLLLQAKFQQTNYTSAGDMHIVIAQIVDQEYLNNQ